MSLQPGARLGPYDILEKLGEGGMGQVYKARDTRLDRFVAIKQSATAFSDRFEREARAVAALNHPAVCQLFDVGPDYLVMEFLDGRPLAPVEGMRKVLDLAVQIADGMAAAHAAGIVHRDLKPDNILVTADGRVKILDFGIAKPIAGDAGEPHTRAALTDAGSAVGTVHYMSPEQARGLATVGPQSDQFSFGLILYELVTGKKAFVRDSSAETLTAIIREDAATLPATVPPPLRWIIERLLAKDPAERYDSSRDLYRELKQLRDRLSDATAPVSGVTIAGPAPVPAGPARWWRWVVPAVILAATAAGLTWTLVPRPAPTPIDLSSYRFTPVSLDAATEREPLWSPDGRSLAYLRNVDGVQHVMVREVGAATAVQLTRGPFNAMLPFWAPDGARIYFMRGPAPVSLYSVSAVGGEPERVIDSATSAALHPRDGRFVFARAGQLFLLDPSSGAAAREPVAFGQTSFTGAVIVRGFSPDGRVLAVVHDATLRMLEYPSGTARTTTIANIPPGGLLGWMPDSRRFVTEKLQDSIGEGLAMVDAETGVSRTILSSPMALLNPRVSPDGTRLAFATGDPRWKLVEVMLADGRLRVLESDNRFSAFPSLSPDGTRLAFVNGSGASNAAIREMALSATGDVVAKTITAIDGEMIEHVQWSPDGARVLFTAVALNGSRVMVAPAGGGRALAVDPGARLSRGGVWSPDGAQIAYRRQLGDEHQLVTVRVGTSAAPVVLRRWTARDPLRLPLAWSPDGRWILTRQSLSLALLASDGSSERQLFSTAGSTERARPMFTRDGREVLLLRRDVAAPEGPWRLFATDIASGTERVLTTVDFPSTAEDVAGLSLSPDGTRLYTSFADWPFDIWMLEGFQ